MVKCADMQIIVKKPFQTGMAF